MRVRIELNWVNVESDGETLPHGHLILGSFYKRFSYVLTNHYHDSQINFAHDRDR